MRLKKQLLGGVPDLPGGTNPWPALTPPFFWIWPAEVARLPVNAPGKPFASLHGVEKT